jgi:glutamine amidotransferase
VASEPFDDGPGWSVVPDRTVLTARPGAVDASPLKPAG